MGQTLDYTGNFSGSHDGVDYDVSYECSHDIDSSYEAEIRDHLGGMLPKGIFDFDRDVESISVNRWAHGYSYGNPGAIGRQPFGRITIANSDSVNSSLMNRAIEQAWRAVKELGK